jgi:long-chain acyl-CoA synthetase
MDLGWLWERIRSAPELPAIIAGDKVCTYRDLAEECLRWREVLLSRRTRPGHIVAIRGDYSREACSLLLALIENDCIIVPLASVNRHQHDFFLETAEVQSVFEILDVGEYRVEDRAVEVKNPLLLKLRQQGVPGLVVFSSGSTGVSKGVLHNFAALLEKYKVPRRRFRTITFLLWDHLGGINTLLYTFSNTGTVVAAKDRTPETICQVIEKHRVQLLPTSPTFLNLLVVSEVFQHFDLSSLELITYGTEPMPASTLLRIREILPEVCLQQTYGLTELGVVRSKSRDDGSLWVKIGGEGFETSVVDGMLWIRAQSAMLGYLNAPDPFQADGWFNTGDEVEVDGEYLLIKGRRSEMINVGGEKVFPAEVESVILECPNVKDVCVFGEKNPITGNIVAAKVNLETKESPIDFRKRLREFCRGRLVPFKIPVRVEIVEGPLYNERVKRIRREVGPQELPSGNQDA